MRWVMQDWNACSSSTPGWPARWRRACRWIDSGPGLRRAFVLVAERRPQRMDDYIAAGRAMQRFWLTATAQGLQLQPE
jgi:nitroreductase